MKTLKLFIALVCLVSITSCNKEKTPLPQGDVADDWIIFRDATAKEYQIFSKVSLDRSFYITDIQILYHGEELKKHPEYCRCKGNWLVDTTLTKIQTCGDIYYDSFGNVVYDDTHIMNKWDWGYVHPGTLGATVAEYAKLLYDNEHNLERYPQPIDIDWGSGEWYKCYSSEDFDWYFTVVEETESSYFGWSYRRYRKINKLSFAAVDNESIGIQRLVYGELHEFEVQKNTDRGRDFSSYYVDKFGDVFYDASDVWSNHWYISDIQPEVVKYVRNNKPRLRKRR